MFEALLPHLIAVILQPLVGVLEQSTLIFLLPFLYMWPAVWTGENSKSCRNWGTDDPSASLLQSKHRSIRVIPLYSKKNALSISYRILIKSWQYRMRLWSFKVHALGLIMGDDGLRHKVPYSMPSSLIEYIFLKTLLELHVSSSEYSLPLWLR